MTSFRWFSPEINDNCLGYDLLLYIGQSHYCYGFFDEVHRSIAGFSESGIDETSNERKALTVLKNAVKNEPMLSHRVKSCKICFHIDKNTLIPSALFEPKSVYDYFSWITEVDEEEILWYDFIKNADCFNIYAIPKKFFKKLHHFFLRPGLWSLHSVLIGNMLRETRGTREKNLFLYKEEQMLLIFFIENGRLIFSNYFQAFTAEEVVYYVLAVCEQLRLNTDAIQIWLLGAIQKNDPCFQLLATYLEHITFAGFPKGIYVPEELRQLPAHQFHHLFALALCE
jgi:hypothetical protein